MPEYLSPGVFVEEIEIGGKPIEGVSTSTAGFLGLTERGPIEPQLITGFAQYERVYGGYIWALAGDKDRARKLHDQAEADKKAVERATAEARTAEGPAKAKAEANVAELTRRAAASKKASDDAANAAKSTTEASSNLPYAIEGFFANGGKRCYVGRIVGKGSAQASVGLREGITISSAGPGSWGNRIAIAVRRASLARGDNADKTFKLVVYYWSDPPPAPLVDPGDMTKLRDPNRREPAGYEEYDNLSWDTGSADYCVRRLHNRSSLIELTQSEAGAGTAPTVGNELQFLTGGDDGATPALDDYTGAGTTQPGEKSGLAALEEIEDISIVCIPDETTIAGMTDALVSHCERLKDRFAILQAKADADPVDRLYPPADSKYAAFYYPWVYIQDPVTQVPKLIPPGGHMAGVYARTDIERGVHKAPANEPLRGVTDLQFNISTGIQDVLNPRGVNCLRTFTGRGIRVWGARTTSTDPLWKYVNVRRLFIFLEKSLQHSTQWVVFEPNNPSLWARLKQGVSDWLTGVWRDGALVGATAEQAFFVKCDETTMTQNDIETGKLIMIIGVAPSRPAEFVIFRLAQWRSGSAIIE